jgi:hypothetical protein
MNYPKYSTWGISPKLTTTLNIRMCQGTLIHLLIRSSTSRKLLLYKPKYMELGGVQEWIVCRSNTQTPPRDSVATTRLPCSMCFLQQHHNTVLDVLEVCDKLLA